MKCQFCGNDLCVETQVTGPWSHDENGDLVGHGHILEMTCFADGCPAKDITGAVSLEQYNQHVEMFLRSRAVSHA